MAQSKSALKRGAEEARKSLPELLDAAENGRTTVITRHGRPIAALVPISAFPAASGQKSLLPLAGSGRGLWGSNSTKTVAALRDEWER
ncbi:MAG: type II toxin-antitoxin system Phd/YefM family antitoxin [Alphaproteobacteria bacterium]|nr:type II toxin-antitoxin system Phd/YefM family antitoxin [Alphaproteobacteria bacterium]